uniref:Uncharacterized protein n=1 Tax=Globodera rostochiensis TaxID=31243 RepID=A0A914HUJ2_GLORO
MESRPVMAQQQYACHNNNRQKPSFPNPSEGAFDDLQQPQANNNPIESQPEIKVEPHEEQFDGRWRDEPALKGIVKVDHEPHYGAVKVEGKVKHEFEWLEEESREFKEQLEHHVKEEDQDGQVPNTSDHKKIGDDNDYWTDQDESVDGQQTDSNECWNIAEKANGKAHNFHE